jgi:zinc protease
MPQVPFPVRREELGGVPVFWAEAPPGPPFMAAAAFRVGRVDEKVPISGITHLVEHLALPARISGSLQFNGFVDLTTTMFWATGDREPVLGFLAELFATLGNLPLSRMEHERSVLATEESGRQHNTVDTSLMLRYGARGPGLVWVDEFGLSTVGPQEVAAWAAERFTRGNCALAFTGPPPESLPELPEGRRWSPPEPEPTGYVRYPSVFPGGPPTAVALSFAPRRSSAFLLAAGTLNDRLVERVRHRLGLSYEIDWWWEPVSDHLAQTVFSVDCRPENVDAARSAALTELDELAFRGPTDAERESDLEQLARMLRDPNEIPSSLFRYCRDELFGSSFQTEAEMYAERADVTAAEAAEALTRAAEELLLLIPEDAARPGGRFTLYPTEQPYRVDGRTYKRRGLPLRRAGPERELVAGDEGVTLVGVDFVNTVRFRDVEGVLKWADGSRTLVGEDAAFITVDPSIWRGGAEIVARIDATVPADRFVPIDELPSDDELQEASDALDRGDAERAVELMRAVAARRPDEAMVQAQLAASYFALERWPETLAAATRARDLDPQLEWGHRFRAYALWHTGRTQTALDAGREALARGPSDLQTLSDFSWFEAEAGDPAEARRIADRAVELYPEEGQAWFARSWAAMSVGDWGDAESACRKAIDFAPEESMWHNNLGWVLLQRGRHGEATKAFEKALKLDRKNGRARFNRAIALREQGREGEARRLLTELLEDELGRVDRRADDGLHADDLAQQARTLVQLGRQPEGREKLVAALELEPDRADLLGELVEVEVDLGDLAAAREALERARKLEAESANTLYSQGYLAAAARDTALGEEAAEAAQRLHPTHRLTPDVAGYAAVARGAWDEAAEHFRTTLVRLPLRSCSQAWLAIALLQSGDAARAAEHAVLARRRCVTSCTCVSIRSLEETLGTR